METPTSITPCWCAEFLWYILIPRVCPFEFPTLIHMFQLLPWPLFSSSHVNFKTKSFGLEILTTTPMLTLSSYISLGPYSSWLLLCSAAAAAKSLQSCPTLCDPIDSSPPGSAIPGILQARSLEWGAISFSSAWKWKVKVKSLSRVWLLAPPWTVAHQAPPSMGVSRQEYWSGVPLPSPTTVFSSFFSIFFF